MAYANHALVVCSLPEVFVAVLPLTLLGGQGIGAVPALPILLLWCSAEAAEDTQLWDLTEAALELCEARELGQREHRVPQRYGLCITGNTRNHRTKKRRPVGRLEGDDRRPHVAARTTEGELGLSFEFDIPPGAVSCRRECRAQAHRVEHVGDVGNRTEFLPHPRTLLLIPVCPTIALVERPHGLAPQFAPHLRGDPQHSQASGVAVLVFGWELRGIVLLFVQQTEG